jgi:hypothetical protein
MFLYRPAFWPGVGLDGLGLRLSFRATSGKSALDRVISGQMARFDRHKILKSRIQALSKARQRWYIRLAPKGLSARVAFSGSLRTGSIGALARWPGSFRHSDF